MWDTVEMTYVCGTEVREIILSRVSGVSATLAGKKAFK